MIWLPLKRNVLFSFTHSLYAYMYWWFCDATVPQMGSDRETEWQVMFYVYLGKYCDVQFYLLFSTTSILTRERKRWRITGHHASHGMLARSLGWVSISISNLIGKILWNSRQLSIGFCCHILCEYIQIRCACVCAQFTSMWVDIISPYRGANFYGFIASSITSNNPVVEWRKMPFAVYYILQWSYSNGRMLRKDESIKTSSVAQ